MRFARFMADVALLGFTVVVLLIVLTAVVYGFLTLLSHGGAVAVGVVTGALAAINVVVWACAVYMMRRR